MKNQIKNLARLIALSIEKYNLELRQFLIKQGLTVSQETSKEEMQIMLLTGLESSEAFKNNFADWANQTIKDNFSNFTGADIPSGISYNPSSTSSLFGSTTPSFNLGLSTSETPKPSLATESTVADTKPTGFFGGFTLNTGLDFIKDTLNSMATIQQSKADQALLSTQITAERDAIASEPNATKSNTTLMVVIGVLALSGLIAGVYFYNKTKK